MVMTTVVTAALTWRVDDDDVRTVSGGSTLDHLRHTSANLDDVAVANHGAW
jgi:hypothetical protein